VIKVIDRESEARHGIDSYYQDNGELPDIVPINIWFAG